MPGLTRRRFCAGAGTALAGASLMAAGCDPQAQQQERTLAAFDALVGTTFTVRDEGGTPRSLRLARIRVHRPPIRVPVPRGESFTLVFEATEPLALAEATRPARHPALGDFALFLVPRQAPDAAGLPTFAATYCRL